MRQIIHLFLLGAVIGPWSASAKTLTVPVDFPTPAQALEAAVAGDVIEVKAGTYPGPFKFKCGVTLRGEDRDKVRFQMPVAAGTVLDAAGCTSGVITGITFENLGRPDPRKEPKGPPIIQLTDSSISIDHCMIRNGAGDGVRAGGEGRVVVRDCEITLNANGISAVGAKMELVATANFITSNRASGIEFSDGARGKAEGNSCRKNNWYGVYVSGAGTDVEVVKNECVEQRANGIYIDKGGRAEVRDNISRENKWTGIHLTDEGTSAVLKGNSCNQNVTSGIGASYGAAVEIRDNVCDGNQVNGINIRALGTRATLTGNTCGKNVKNGIFVDNGAIVTATGNACNENTKHGIYARGFETTPVFTDNECSANKMDGIRFADEAGGEVSGNTCRGNEQYGLSLIHRGAEPKVGENSLEENKKENFIKTEDDIEVEWDVDEVQWLFRTDKFARLDGLARRLRANKSRYPSSEWQLYFFYENLTYPSEGDGKARLQKGLDATQRWIAADPESITARTAHVAALKDLAWTHRGGGYADSVTDEGWKQFHALLTEARAAYTEAAKLKEKDPQLHATALTVGMGLGLDPEEMDKIFIQGTLVEPVYYPLYRTRATDLMPRWSGSAEEAEAFAAKSADDTQAIEGDGLYARIAEALMKYGATADYVDDFAATFDYTRIKKGYEDILKTYKEPIYVKNNYCLMACLHDDRATAADLFNKIGDDWDRRVWNNDGTHTGWKNWALNNGPRPELKSSHAPTGPLFSMPPILKTPSFWVLLALTPVVLVLLILFVRQQQ